MQNIMKDFDTTSILQIMFNKHEVTEAKWAQFLMLRVFFLAISYPAQTRKENLHIPKKQQRNDQMIKRSEPRHESFFHPSK